MSDETERLTDDELADWERWLERRIAEHCGNWDAPISVHAVRKMVAELRARRAAGAPAPQDSEARLGALAVTWAEKQAAVHWEYAHTGDDDELLTAQARDAAYGAFVAEFERTVKARLEARNG